MAQPMQQTIPRSFERPSQSVEQEQQSRAHLHPSLHRPEQAYARSPPVSSNSYPIGSSVSTGNVANPYSTMLSGGIHDSGSRSYESNHNKVAGDYNPSTTVDGLFLQVNIAPSEPVSALESRSIPTGVRYPPAGSPVPGSSSYQRVADDGPFGLLREVNSLRPSAPYSSPALAESPYKSHEAAANPVGTYTYPSFQSSFTGSNSGVSDPSQDNVVRRRFRRIWHELSLISKNHRSITKILKDHKQFIPDLWAQLQGQVATITAQRQTLLEEVGDEGIQSSLPDDLVPYLEKVGKALRGVTQHLDEFVQSLNNAIQSVDSRKLTLQLSRLRNHVRKGGDEGPRKSKIKQQLDGFSIELQRITHKLNSFRDQCNELLEMIRSVLPSDVGEDTDDDTDEELTLETFRISRHASDSLYQQLSQMCPEHHAHQFYFHLPSEEPEAPPNRRINFYLSVERKNVRDNGPKRIWFCAQASFQDDSDDDELEEEDSLCSHHSSGLSTRSTSSVRFNKSRRPLYQTRHRNTDDGTSRAWATPRSPRPGTPSRPAWSKESWRRASTGRINKSPRSKAQNKTGSRRAERSEFLRRTTSCGPQCSPPGSTTKQKLKFLTTGTFCLENMRQGTGQWAADLPRFEESRGVSCQLHFPSHERVPAIPPMPLSEWIDKARASYSSAIERQLACIRVAKQIVRSVLSFGPNFWPQQRPLLNTDILILQGNESLRLQSLLDVHTTRRSSEKAKMPDLMAQSAAERQFREAALDGDSSQSHPTIILHLAVILLELAYLEPMPKLREAGPDGTNRNKEYSRSLRSKCDARRVFGGEAYARAVKHCINFNESAETFFSNVQHQRKFYREVIVKLDEAEMSALKTLELQNSFN